jgi:hypothetical protein
MPRIARLDTPGLLHHVVIRGIERQKIFKDDEDRENLLEWQNTEYVLGFFGKRSGEAKKG